MKRWPLILFMLLAVGAIAATVLLANDRRNLKAVFDVLGIRPVVPQAGPPPPLPVTPTRSPDRWPWLAGAASATPIRLFPAPEQMCRDQAVEGQEEPSFTQSPERGWECSMLRTDLAAAASSLFLQARGRAYASFTGIRVKFNLAGKTISQDLASEAVDFVFSAASMLPEAEMEAALEQKLLAGEDFYFLAGYYRMTFRREMDTIDRFNLVGVDRTAVIGAAPPHRWSMDHRSESVEGDRKLSKGPRLPASPARSD